MQKEQYIRIAVIIIEETKILLAHHNKGGKDYWTFPGGHLDYGETTKECAKRELKEEANLVIKVGDLIWVVESIPSDGHRQVLNLFYAAKIISGEISCNREEGLEEIRFIDLNNLSGLIIYPDLKVELNDWLCGRRETIYLGNKWN